MKRFSLLRREGRSFRCALRGIGGILATEPHARFHAVAGAVMLLAGWWTGLDAGEWMLLVFAIGLVWTAEALNTALEYLTDLLHPERHPLAARAKDAAAGAVLLASLTAAAVGFLLFAPRLRAWWQG